MTYSLRGCSFALRGVDVRAQGKKSRRQRLCPWHASVGRQGSKRRKNVIESERMIWRGRAVRPEGGSGAGGDVGASAQTYPPMADYSPKMPAMPRLGALRGGYAAP
jgi:hypothetical protein